jgi:hypothetical protein
VRFYVGCHQPSDAQHFERSFVSVKRIEDRRSAFTVRHWVLDSGAFSEIKDHGRFLRTVDQYAEQARRWIGHGHLDAVVSQDYMCEPFVLARTGLDVDTHQRLTIERYDELLAHGLSTHVMPVLQGYTVAEYLDHLARYGDRLSSGMWVGVGSVCKRQGKPADVIAILGAIKRARPDLRLHGFGVKITSLARPEVRHLLYSADSMAWSKAARSQGRNGNDWREAEAFRCRIDRHAFEQEPLPL